MGWWVSAPMLARGESVRWSVFANREQSANRQVGGRLFVTTTRLLFEPNRFDSLTGGRPWRLRFDDIAQVEVLPARLTVPFLGRAAANRRRLKVVGIDETIDCFVVNHVAAVVERLAELTSAIGRGFEMMISSLAIACF